MCTEHKHHTLKSASQIPSCMLGLTYLYQSAVPYTHILQNEVEHLVHAVTGRPSQAMVMPTPDLMWGPEQQSTGPWGALPFPHLGMADMMAETGFPLPALNPEAALLLPPGADLGGGF